MKNQTLMLYQRLTRALLPITLLAMGACGGGGGGDDAPPVVVTPPADTINTYNVSLTADEVPGGSSEPGSATAVVAHNVTDAQVSVTVTLIGITADTVSLRRGFAGSNGDEVYALSPGSSATEWLIQDQPFTTTDVAELDAGALYVSVTTVASPDSAIRGQVLPVGVDVHQFALVADQVVDGGNSAASGMAWLTDDRNASNITLHVVTSNLADADAAVASRAIAGLEGPALVTLSPDATDTAHWMLDTTATPAEAAAAIDAGEFYVTLSSPGFTGGAVRGQLLATGQELVITDLSSAAVPLSEAGSSPAASGDHAMTTVGSTSLSIVVALESINDVDSVQLHQAPAGQNGPVIASLDQDINDPGLWTLIGEPLNSVLQTGLDNRSLYINVTTPSEPGGAVRGQLETADSGEPGDTSAFRILAIDPMNAAQLDDLPDTIFVTLNREPLVSSVTPQAVTVKLSGGDGSFSDGNEVDLVPSSVSANGNTVEISLAGVAAEDDVYLTTVRGGGANGIVDQGGIPLDGDDNGEPGGAYESSFEVEQVVVAASLTNVQELVFTPSCATSGCHSGSNPPDGLLLTAGDTYSNTVSKTAVQMSSLSLIEPGDPDNSYLVRKIEGVNIVASRMPLGASKLSQDKIDLVRQWVSEGALDN